MGNIVCYSADGDILQYYTQWDVNQKLIIKGADTSSAPDFHFLNTLMSDTYVVESQISGGEIIVDVPDELLQYEVPIIAHVSYVDGTTEYTVRIPIMPRKKPVNYIYTETDSGSGSGSGGSSGTQVSIANNLNTNNANMVLSAAQGVVIKKMIDDIDLEIESMIDLTEMTNAISDAVKDKVGIDAVNLAISNALKDFSGEGSGGSGQDGEDGATFIPNLNQDGTLSWSNDKGLVNPEPVNIKGDPGETPERGVHYWTETDISEIKSYLDDVIIGGRW